LLLQTLSIAKSQKFLLVAGSQTRLNANKKPFLRILYIVFVTIS